MGSKDLEGVLLTCVYNTSTQMHMYMYMYMYMYMFMYMYMHAFMHTCIHASMHTYIHVCILCIYIYILRGDCCGVYKKHIQALIPARNSTQISHECADLCVHIITIPHFNCYEHHLQMATTLVLQVLSLR